MTVAFPHRLYFYLKFTEGFFTATARILYKYSTIAPQGGAGGRGRPRKGAAAEDTKDDEEEEEEEAEE